MKLSEVLTNDLISETANKHGFNFQDKLRHFPYLNKYNWRINHHSGCLVVIDVNYSDNSFSMSLFFSKHDDEIKKDADDFCESLKQYLKKTIGLIVKYEKQ